MYYESGSSNNEVVKILACEQDVFCLNLGLAISISDVSCFLGKIEWLRDVRNLKSGNMTNSGENMTEGLLKQRKILKTTQPNQLWRLSRTSWIWKWSENKLWSEF